MDGWVKRSSLGLNRMEALAREGGQQLVTGGSHPFEDPALAFVLGRS